MTVIMGATVRYLDGSPDDVDLFLLASAMGVEMEITTEAENQAALDRIFELWNAKPDTPEDAELDGLLAAVVKWEEQYTERTAPQTPGGNGAQV